MVLEHYFFFTQVSWLRLIDGKEESILKGLISTLCCSLYTLIALLTHQGHGRIGGHYFHTGCPYVSPFIHPSVTKTQTRYNASTGARKTKHVLRRTRLDNDHLLAVAWWVTLKSPDL